MQQLRSLWRFRLFAMARRHREGFFLGYGVRERGDTNTFEITTLCIPHGSVVRWAAAAVTDCSYCFPPAGSS
jgi:hypothetical protein